MNHHIPENQALIITGPQGAGKTLLAKEIARKEGLFVEVTAHDLERPYGLDSAADGGTEVIICDGIPSSKGTLEKIKRWITESRVRINPKYREPMNVKPPKFIFCTMSHEPIPSGRRFVVVKLDRRAEPAT